MTTPNNFGKMGTQPSNPELLDWLATEFVRKGWSIKQMQREIMNSETYKMASTFYDANSLAKDPTDQFMWRFPVKRMEAEIIRDAVLSASGDLNPANGWSGVLPAGAEEHRGRRIHSGYMDGDQGRSFHLETKHLRQHQAQSEVPDV